ncbi:DUF2066 domain-containing protein [Marinobacter sp. X15-166B]|uniref:DUF2066 domain-containing protein n=1 Tax=Marinobacter sp. X15-166B TaxID=1897620 RepID=UPI00085C4AF6|nr:DUF2066 domain-containing protein [Marinobacter sp. X15-166B]OEY67795.1 hypothetical protein BG841_16100 [Marinobacter sp. X15-166B]
MTKPFSRAMLLRLLWLIIPLLGVSLPVAAVIVDGLYTVEVPVSGSQPDQLQAGYAEGLSQVFLRVSGSSEVLRQAEVRALLQEADTLLQAYQFLRADDGEGDRLRMTFGAVGVNRALASVGAPVWGANRPLTLAWVAVQDNRGRQLLVNPKGGAAAAGDAWQQAFTNAAARRGLPILLPPARLADDRQLLSEVWGQFMGSIRDASAEWGHDLLATVRINRDGSGWRASWLVEGRGVAEVESSVRGANPGEVANRVVDVWADMLGAKYAVAAGDVSDSAQVDLVIEGVRNQADYAELHASLGNMTPVVRAGAVKVNPDRAIVRVDFTGELSQLKEYIALDQRFVPMPAPRVMMSQPQPSTVAGPAGGESVTEITGAENTGVQNAGQAAVEDPAATAEFSYPAPAPDSENGSFESLYPDMYYRWQAGTILQQGAGE